MGLSPIRVVGARPYGRRMTAPATPAADDATLLEHVLFEVRKVVVGQERLVERLLVALLAGGLSL